MLPNIAPKRFLSSGETRVLKGIHQDWALTQSLWGRGESWCCEGLVQGAPAASREELLSWIWQGWTPFKAGMWLCVRAKPLSFSLSLLLSLPHFFSFPTPQPLSLFLTLPELITPPGHPEKNNQVRNHAASLTAQPSPTNPYLRGGHSYVSPGPPRDFLFIPLSEALAVSIFGKGSWQTPWEGKQGGGLVERMWLLGPGGPWALLQLCHLIPG